MRETVKVGDKGVRQAMGDVGTMGDGREDRGGRRQGRFHIYLGLRGKRKESVVNYIALCGRMVCFGKLWPYYGTYGFLFTSMSQTMVLLM